VWRPSRGWAGFAARVVVASVALGALLAWAASGLDWLALRREPGLRALWLAAVVAGSALLYLGLLHVFGLRLRQFVRRG
jgi:putative peptidoglycan lipid II flippase